MLTPNRAGDELNLAPSPANDRSTEPFGADDHWHEMINRKIEKTEPDTDPSHLILSLHLIRQSSSSSSSSSSVSGTGRVLGGGTRILAGGICGLALVPTEVPPGRVGGFTTAGGGVATGGLVTADGV